MFVHIFGAYFGLACSKVMYRADLKDADPKDCSIYHSDVFSMIGRPPESCTKWCRCTKNSSLVRVQTHERHRLHLFDQAGTTHKN